MISRERIFYITDKIIEELVRQKIPIKDSRLLKAVIINELTKVTKLLESIDERVRNKISNSRNAPPEGSPSWLALYENYFNEEISTRLKR